MHWGLKTVIAVSILTCPITLQQGADARLPDVAKLQIADGDTPVYPHPGYRVGQQLFLPRWTAAEQDIAALQVASPFGVSVIASLSDFGAADPWGVTQVPERKSESFAVVTPKVARPEPKIRVVQLQFDRPALAPLAHSVFCLKYPADCAASNESAGGMPIKMTPVRWSELERVNAEVNRSIVSEPNTKGLAAEKWLIAPKSGECHDYAVTKRHELMALGWSESDLLLAEVIVPSGEHHLVLLVRTSDGDFVADNLTHEIRSWYKTPYQWLRVQSASNPMVWSTVSGRPVWVARSSLSSHAQS